MHLADDWLGSQYRRAAEAIDAQLLADHPFRTSPRRPVGGPLLLPGWNELAVTRPGMGATMLRCLTQIGALGTLGMFSSGIDELGLARRVGAGADRLIPVDSVDLERSTRRPVGELDSC